MDQKKAKPVAYMSANSKNLRNFQAKQKFKLLFSGLVLTAPLLAGGLWYVNRNEDMGSSSIPIAISGPGSQSEDDTQLVNQDLQQLSQDELANQVVPAGPSSESGGSQPSATPSSPSPQEVGGIPSGVTTAINSMEATGIKGNPYVASSIDTSMLPEGTTVTFNRATWSPSDANSGTMAASLTAGGQFFNGVITFSSAGGTWKATGYSIQ